MAPSVPWVPLIRRPHLCKSSRLPHQPVRHLFPASARPMPGAGGEQGLIVTQFNPCFYIRGIGGPERVSDPSRVSQPQGQDSRLFWKGQGFAGRAEAGIPRAPSPPCLPPGWSREHFLHTGSRTCLQWLNKPIRAACTTRTQTPGHPASALVPARCPRG